MLSVVLDERMFRMKKIIIHACNTKTQLIDNAQVVSISANLKKSQLVIMGNSVHSRTEKYINSVLKSSISS